MATEKMTGAQAVVRCLELEGVDWLFGDAGRHHPAPLRRDVRLEA